MLEIFKSKYRSVRERANQYLLAYKWKKGGRTEPPPHLIKEKVIEAYASRFSVETLVETGTYFGEMVFALRKKFRRIISIELDTRLFERASGRFRNFSHITIVQGDSESVLPSVLKREYGRYLFWLDGHYSEGETAKGEKDTPIVGELQHIKRFTDDAVILIDDARLFVGQNDYPTVAELESLVKELWRDNIFEVRDDIIRITPPQTK